MMTACLLALLRRARARGTKEKACPSAAANNTCVSVALAGPANAYPVVRASLQGLVLPSGGGGGDANDGARGSRQKQREAAWL